MKKVRKGKKLLIISAIALIAIIVAVIIIVNLVNKKPGEPIPPDEGTQQVIPLPETTYSDMEVKNIQMEYLKNNDETMITMRIYNSTDAKVEKKKFTAILIGPDEKILAEMGPININSIDVGEVKEYSVIYDGDLTATQQIKLQEK